jgi:hypothetical protein
MGLDVYLEWEGQTKEEIEAQYTGFQSTGECGYLRSPYNDGGFNSWAKRHLGGKDLYWIFDYSGDAEVQVRTDDDGEPEMGFKPDWIASRNRALEALECVKALDNFFTVRARSPRTIFADEAEALAAFREQARTRTESSFECYSNTSGLFNFGDPFKVKAVMATKAHFSEHPDIILVCSEEDPHKFYREMIEKEILGFIELGKRKNAWISWSG